VETLYQQFLMINAACVIPWKKILWKRTLLEGIPGRLQNALNAAIQNMEESNESS
jgi:hypothetical protein